MDKAIADKVSVLCDEVGFESVLEGLIAYCAFQASVGDECDVQWEQCGSQISNAYHGIFG